MKKLQLAIFFFCAFLNSKAQTGIGTTTPHASAKLDVSASNKGFLPPRVTLTSATDASTIASPAEGLLVYNLGSVGLQAGYYYWNGANWATIATATSAGNGVTSMDLVKLYSKSYSAATADSTIANATGYKFIVPVSGRYVFDFSSTCFANSMTFSVRQGTTVLASDAQTSVNNSVHVEYNGKMEVNLQSGVTYNVYVSIGTGYRDAGDYDRVYYKLIAGNLPVTGQSVDYVSVLRNSDLTVNTGDVLKFNSIYAGNIPYDALTGNFSLTAGKTYRLNASISLSNANTTVSEASVVWKNAAGDLLGSKAEILSASHGTNAGGNAIVEIVYTPITNTTVSLNIIYATPNAILWNGFTYANIQQIGSSAFVNPWTLSGTNSYNTTGNVGIGTSSPTSRLNIVGGGVRIASGLGNSSTRPSVNTSSVGNYEIRGVGGGVSQIDGQDDGFLRLSAGGGTNAIQQSSIDLSGYSATVPDMNSNIVMRTAGTERVRIDNSGNVNVTGKLNVSDAGGGVAVKAAGFVNAGTAVTLGDIQVQMSTSGSRSLQIKTTGSSFTGMASAHTTYSNSSYTYYSDKSFTVDANYGYIGGVTWSFGTDGDLSVYYVRDTTNHRFYRLTLMVGNVTAYTNNFISIERLL